MLDIQENSMGFLLQGIYYNGSASIPVNLTNIISTNTQILTSGKVTCNALISSGASVVIYGSNIHLSSGFHAFSGSETRIKSR